MALKRTVPATEPQESILNSTPSAGPISKGLASVLLGVVAAAALAGFGNTLRGYFLTDHAGCTCRLRRQAQTGCVRTAPCRVLAYGALTWGVPALRERESVWPFLLFALGPSASQHCKLSKARHLLEFLEGPNP